MKVPTLVIWGMKDAALLPLQLDGLDELVEDLTHRAPARRRPFRAVGSAATRSPPRSSPSLRRMPAASAAAHMTQTRSRSRSAARLAAVQALYQQEMEGTPAARACSRNSTITGSARRSRTRHYHEAERDFFDDIVTGADARRDEIDALISARLAEGWSLERLDRPMRAILRAGAYELIARADVPVGSVISEYVDVAHAFYDKRESGFVNGLLDAIAKEARPARA